MEVRDAEDRLVSAFSSPEPFDHLELYRAFLGRESDGSGTVVLHHGRVKRPGKRIADFSKVELRALVDDPDAGLASIARRAKETYGLNQVLVVHRLGSVGAGDTVLLAIVSGHTRDRCFAACSWIVDEIKKEELIGLMELP